MPNTNKLLLTMYNIPIIKIKYFFHRRLYAAQPVKGFCW